MAYSLVVAGPDQKSPDEDDKAKDAAAKTPKPIVVDRCAFKSDADGDLRGERMGLPTA